MQIKGYYEILDLEMDLCCRRPSLRSVFAMDSGGHSWPLSIPLRVVGFITSWPSSIATLLNCGCLIFQIEKDEKMGKEMEE